MSYCLLAHFASGPPVALGYVEAPSTVVGRALRLEVWSDLACASGARLAVVRDLLGLTDVLRLDGAHKLTATLPQTDPAMVAVRELRVLRVVAANGEFDEWRIHTIEERRDGEGVVSVLTAAWVVQDLEDATLVGRVESDGLTHYDFEGLSLTPTQHLVAFILPALAAAGLPWVTLGTLEGSAPVDLVYSWDSPLAALQRLAETAGLEFRLRRVGSTGYVIDLLLEIGAAAPLVDLRVGRNLPGLVRTRSAVEQVNRVFPRGTRDADGFHATIAEAEWQVTAVSGNNVTLADPAGGDPPLAFDDQLNGRYLRRADGALVAIVDTIAATQVLTLTSAAGVGVGDRVRVRADAAGAQLTWLDAPAEQATTRRKVGMVDRPGIPATVNLIRNPTMRAWTGAASTPPDDWVVTGTPVITRVTVAAA